jgi:hypothetical protein
MVFRLFQGCSAVLSSMSDRARQSPIDRARRRVRSVKIAAVVAALGAFTTTTVLARAAHPGSAGTSAAGTATVSRPASAEVTTERESESTGSFFSPGSLSTAGANATPQASTHTS